MRQPYEIVREKFVSPELCPPLTRERACSGNEIVNLAVQNINGPYFKEIYGNSKRRLKAYSYTRKEHWTWSTNMAAMTSKFDFECVIQYYTDQWLWHNPSHNRI